MKWIHIKGNMYKCPACGMRFTIGKKWKCCPVCEQELSGVEEQSVSDYIKREDAIRAVNHLQKQFQLNANELEFGLILKDVFRDAIPSADVAEVVRCKDCKYRNDDNGNCYVSNFITGLPCMIRYVGEDDYCSYGKHKGARA